MAEDRPADKAGFCIKAGSMTILAFPVSCSKALTGKSGSGPQEGKGEILRRRGSAFACRRSGNPEPGKGRPVFGMGIALYI